jgi:FkbM family methyltransferase
MENKKKLLLFTPHLSTGGLPQVLVNKINLLKDEYNILVVEHHNHAWLFNVQRNRIIDLLGQEKLITLREGDRETHFFEILNEFKPNTIYFEEFPEYFLEDKITSKIYVKEREYTIIETTHDSSFPVSTKRWFPDKFIFVSPFNAFRYSVYDIPYEIVEYPVDFKERNQEYYKQKLGLESDWLHVVNVGLFTPRKNQAYIFEMAKKLKGKKIKFHFLGNQAGNFQDYWQPLMADKPDNCVVWGERNDVYDFLQASDLFFFASKGDKNNKELNPIAIKEALEFKVPMLMYNLDVYCGKYDMYDNIHYLTGDITQDTNKLLEIFNMETMEGLLHLDFVNETNSIYITYTGHETLDLMVSIKCMTSGAPMYSFKMSCSHNITWQAIPIPPHVIKFHQNWYFRGFLIEFYDVQTNKLKHSETIVVNDIFPNLPPLNFEPFDCSYRNYIEFFVDDIYGNFNLGDLDTVIDVGANIGLFAKYMYKKNAKKVILVEANPLLDKNIKSVMGNDYSNSPTYLAPLFGEKTTVKYRYSSTNSTIGTLVFDNSNISYNELDSEMDIETITLDEIIKENNLKRISLFKSDIEGGEYSLIESLTDEQMLMIDRFMIEFHGNDSGELIPLVDKLNRYGFECEFWKLEMVDKFKTTINESHGVLITKPKNQKFIKPFSDFTAPEEIKKICKSFHREIFYENEYNRHGVNVERGDIVVDCGANIGLFTQYSLDNNASRVVSIESDSETYSHLINNITDFRTTLLNNTVGFGLLTLESIIQEHNLPRIDYLKVDIEGSEYDFLDYTPDYIYDKINKIAIEFHCWSYYDGEPVHYDRMISIKNKLENLGFNCTLDEVHYGSNLFMLYCKK